MNRVKSFYRSFKEVANNNKNAVVGFGTAIGTAIATSAHATPVVDYTAMGTAITAELSPTIASAMPIAGTLLAITVGYKLFRRFTK